MGLGIFSRLFSKRKVSILMVGLDGAGKTTILYRLKLGEVMTTQPTVGFNVETVEHSNIRFTVWDVGGQNKIRALWRHYYFDTQAIIFVVDSTDGDRLEEARDELMDMLPEDNHRNRFVLVLANKQDIDSAMTAEEITDKLKLRSIANRKWHVQATSAMTGKGLEEGLNWLSRHLK